MNKHKILTLALAIGLLITNNIAISAELNKNIKPISAKLKGGVTDYKAEYVNKDWWNKFQDPVLNDYILKAVNQNRDIKIASLKVFEAQQLAIESLGKEFPTLTLGGNFNRQKTSNNTSFGSFAMPSYTQNNFNFPLNVNYELDIWLKNRDKTIQQAKELESVMYDEKSAYIALTSSVAATYFNIINIDEQLKYQNQKLKLRKDILEMTRENYNQGLYEASDVISTEKALTEAENILSDLYKQQTIFLNQLAVLIGENVGISSEFKRTSINEINLISNLPLVISSELIQARPDILKAEAQLQKARIDVSLAKKDFLPNINLSGQFGFNAISLAKVFTWDSYIASASAGLAQTLFSGGQRRARLKLKNYQYKEMLENYQNTILKSLQEVNDSLAILKADTQKNTNNLSRIKSEKENMEIINNKYKFGAISYLDT